LDRTRKTKAEEGDRTFRALELGCEKEAASMASYTVKSRPEKGEALSRTSLEKKRGRTTPLHSEEERVTVTRTGRNSSEMHSN